MVQPAQSKYNFEQTLYEPDPVTLRLRQARSLEQVVQQLTLTRVSIQQRQCRGRLLRIQAIYELTGAVSKKLEEHAPRSSGMSSLVYTTRKAFSRTQEMNFSEFQAELTSYLTARKASLLQEIVSTNTSFAQSQLEYTKGTVASRLGRLLYEGKEVLSQESIYKEAFEAYRSYLKAVLAKCEFGKIHELCVEAINFDPELTFIEDFLETNPDRLRLYPLNGTLTSLGNNSEQIPDEIAKTSVKMLNLAISLMRTHSSDKISELDLYKQAYKLFQVSRFLSQEPLSESEYKLAVLMLKELLESAKVLEHACMIEEVVRLLCQKQQEVSWLDLLVASKPNDGAIQLCLDALLLIKPTKEKVSRVFNRFLQLSCIEEEKRKLTSTQMFFLAYKIESDLVFMEFDTRRIDKSPQTKVSRTIIRDAQQGDLFLLGKSKGGEIQPFMRQNPFKKFSRVIVLPQNSKLPAQSAFQWVNRIHTDKTQTKPYEYFANDARLHVSLNGQRGIWKVLNYIEYDKLLTDGIRVKKISLITEEAEGNLGNIFQQQIELENWQLFEIMEQICHGVHYMHSKARILHGDIKPKNILFKRVNGRIVAGLIDFELAWKMGQAIPFTYSRYASYGTAEYTAPEVLGNKYFHGDFEKCDVFALGLIFYEWLFNEQAEWQELLSRNFKVVSSMDDRLEVEEIIKTNVEAPLANSNKKNHLNGKELLQRLTYNMLRLNPEHRFNMTDVKIELAKIRQQLQGGPALYAPLQLHEHKAPRKPHKNYPTLLAVDVAKLQLS